MRVLVVGGTGMLGDPVARRLAADGHQVRIFTRHAEAARQRFPAPFEVVGGDVEDRAAVARALEGCEAVHLSLDGKGDWDLERRGAECVAAAARQAGAQRISLISGASAAEENAWFPMTRAKLAAERAVAQSGVPFSILRCTMFMEMLPRFVHGQRALVMGAQPNPWHFVAAADYARMVSRALVAPEAADKTFLVLGPEALTMEQALESYRSLCAPQAKLTRVPFFLLRLMSLMPGRTELRQVGLPLMRYFAAVHECGSSAETDRILGKPETTLEAWCRSRAAVEHA